MSKHIQLASHLLCPYGHTGIEAEIRQLDNLAKLTPSEQNRLKDLKAELVQIRKTRDSHQSQSTTTGSSALSKSATSVIIDPATGLPAINPSEGTRPLRTTEQISSNHGSSSAVAQSAPRTMDWFGPDGKLLEPEKSFYYDPVFNPFGVPPPGMPMRMKPEVDDGPSTASSHQPKDTVPHEAKSVEVSTQFKTAVGNGSEGNLSAEESKCEFQSENDTSESDEEEDESDDDIPLPDGPPPPVADSEDEDDDDICLPDGPPPIQEPIGLRCQPPIHPPYLKASELPHRPSRPGDFAPPPFYSPPITLVPGIGPPPMANGFGSVPFPMGPNGLPLPPPSFHNFHPLPIAPASAQLPSKPMVSSVMPQNSASHGAGLSSGSKSVVQASATLTALPQLRDLKREATSFVPSAIRKKRKELDRRADLAGLGDSHRIRAAPGTGDDMEFGNDAGGGPSSVNTRPQGTSLLGALKRDGIVVDVKHGPTAAGGAEKDDYDKFVQSLGDVL